MKKLKYLFILLLAGTLVSSCVDDTAPEDAFGEGPNMAAFTNASMNFSVVANGNEYVQPVPVKVKGPSLAKISNSVTATISVDPSSTAVENLHFRLDQNTIEISPDNNFLAELPITVLTAGIEAPLAETPVLVLNITSAAGDGNVIAAGKKLSINLLYLCNSTLEGAWNLHVEYYRPGLIGTYDRVEEITKTGDGEYRTTYVGHWTVSDLGGTPGFTFIDVCDEITIPEQNLVDTYSNIVLGVDGASYADPDNGIMYFEYTVCASDCRVYKATYTRL